MTIDTLRYPLDLGAKNSKAIPYVQIRIAKYRERILFQDYKNAVSLISDRLDAESKKKQDNAGVFTDEQQKWLLDNNKKKLENLNSMADVTVELANVFLPLPLNLQNTYQPMWQQEDMFIINGLRDVADAASRGDGEATIYGIAGTVLAAASNNNGGLLSQKLFGVTPNPKKQAFFTGIEARTFTLEYTFSAQSKKEAEVIENIIKTLTKYSLPSLASPTDSFFSFPAEFMINFVNVEGFPKLNWCVCTGVSTNYAPGSMQILESGHAIQIGLIMTFQEASLRTQESMGL